MMQRYLPSRTIGLLLALAVALAAGVPSAQADDVNSTRGFRKAVTLAGIREHQAAFQTHSDANGGNRVAGGPGYEASANYVAARMQTAGYTVSSQYFTFLFNADSTPPLLQAVGGAAYVDGVDFASMTFSTNGDVSGPLYAVDLVLPPTGAGNNNTSGCEAADFASFPAGAIALMQRGTCSFGQKAANAAAAGALGAVIFNEGQPGRQVVLNGTLGGVVAQSFPTVGTSYATGLALLGNVATGSGATGNTVRVRVDRLFETRSTRNVIAETPGGDPNNVVVIGAHLDSVPRGAGINDNGSGSATILEIAEVFASQQRTARNKLRFVWWGAEELGLIGSNYYVAQLSQTERDQIALNLNFDMVGSPNYVRFVYDGDNSAFPVGPGAAAGPDGSGEIERIFHSYFDSQNLASAETPFSGRSDYGPFIAVGIPAGGLFTGAEGVKTAEQAALFGGTADLAYDPCYHLACDTYANNSDTGLHEMADAAAHSVLLFAKRNFAQEPLTDLVIAEGDGANGDSQGLHDDHDHEPVDR